jgi:hypothetical protein
VKEHMKYEKPALVDLRSDSALGYTSCNTSGMNVGSCNLGSCVIDSNCNSGTEANACVSGSGACVPGLCSYACCFTGSGVEGSVSGNCWCGPGGAAGWDCSGGTRASVSCDAGGQEYCEL